MKIEGKKISKEYIRKGEGTNIFSAVQPLDFALESGTLTVISGRSGSGKSTLLNMLAGLLKPSTGSVIFNGDQDIYALNDEELSSLRNRYFGFIPQVQSPISSLTVLENVLLPVTLGANGIPGVNGELIEAGEGLLESLDILNLKDIMPGELSGGELRRMSIARALIMDPEFIFADEPTGDLDDENTRRVLDLLREKADRGKAVLLVTHENDALQYGDLLYNMTGGILENIEKA